MNLNYAKYRCLKPFKSWRNKYLKHLVKKDKQGSILYDEAVKEISEYTREPVEVIKQKHKMGPENEKDFEIFKSQGSITREGVEGFYKGCNYSVYELPLWNAETNRPKYLRLITLPYLLRNNYKQVMDFGGGAGDFSIELAGNGLAVTYCDISEELYNFAKWRFERRSLPVKMVKGIDGFSDEAYDCVFSFDAFEHIKDLPELLKKLVKRVKPGGSLVFSGAFSGGTLHLEENGKFNDFKELDSLMRERGLAFQDKFAQFYFYKLKCR